jgi:virginiamycin B lyase
MKRFRRQMVATAAALGVAGVVVGTAAAVDQVQYIPVPSQFSQPLGITAGPDGNMWFADPGAQSIGKMVPGSNPLLIPAPDAGGPAGITSGPGGVWYSEFGTPGAIVPPPADSARVTRMTTGGSTAPTTLPGALNLQGITQGPDGNIWVAAKGTDQLWKVGVAGGAPSGANTAYGPATNAQSVSKGPAGDPNIYVTTSTGVLRTSTSAPGAPGLFSPLANAFGITVGPDGNFWVTHPGGIEHISSANGAPLGGGVALPGSDSRGVAIGPDGALWFAQYATDTVGVVTTSGQYRAIPVPACDGPEGVAAGPDGAVYVTCFGSNVPLVRGRTIVRITQGAAGGGGGGPAGGGGGGGPVAVAGLKGSFSLKKTVIAGKAFNVTVKFNRAVTKSQVRVQIRHANTKPKRAIKKFKTIKSRLVTGTRASIPVKIAKPGKYMLRVTYRNGPATVNTKAIKLTVKPKPARR